MTDNRRWCPWQLSPDAVDVYGDNAGMWIVCTEDGEEEVVATPMTEQEACRVADDHNAQVASA